MVSSWPCFARDTRSGSCGPVSSAPVSTGPWLGQDLSVAKVVEIQKQFFPHVAFVYDTPLALATFSHIGIRNKLFNLGNSLNPSEPPFAHC